MASEENNYPQPISVNPAEAGSITPDIEPPDSGRSEYYANFEATAEGKNLNEDVQNQGVPNADLEVPRTEREEGNDNLGERQMRIIGRMSG